MNHNLRVILRCVVAIVCIVGVVYFQRIRSVEALGYMFASISGLLAVLFDYNYDFNHPKRD